ncbi:MAG: NADH:flavin oxidoreductase [Spirochaetales bacterium]|nr:NADH:flavin oxidoreductase [Spirochaetales bacterium]
MGVPFSPVSIGALRLPNRFARSATHAFMADEQGRVTAAEEELVRRLAGGGVGLIVVGHAYVRPQGRVTPSMLGLDDDDKIPGFARLAAAVHGEGPARIVAQLNHAVPEGPAFAESEGPRLVEAWGAAAARAREAGLDGVQIHAAHGYLLNQSLSPLTNRRTDAYGGSLENRARLLREILVEVRRRVGPEFPLLMKLASSDGQPGGLTLEESVQVARWARDSGLAALEVSGGLRPGMNMRRPKRVEDEGFFREQARAFKQALSIPVISVHGYRSLAVMHETLASGAADLIALCRPLIREPDLIERFRRGSQERSTCISCNECLKRREPLRCWQPEG